MNQQRQIKRWALLFLLPFFVGASPVEKTLSSLEHLPKMGQAAECAATPSPTPVKYDCKIIPLNDTPMPALKKSKTKGDEISIFQDNDNTLLMFLEYGDDVGYTNGLGASYLKQLPGKHPEKNKSLSFDVMSELYTKEKPERPMNGKNYAVNFIDVSRFKASYRQGKKFYFLMGVGVENRQTQLTKKNHHTFETGIQEDWHQLFNLDLNQYDPAGNSVVKRFSKTSVQANLGGGIHTQLYEGRCELNAGANVSIATEDKTLIGQNSYASVEGGVKANLMKNKNGDQRFIVGLDASMLYFPKGAEDVGQVGARARLSLASNFVVRKSKNVLQPFMTFTLPVGRQVFAPMTDNDIIQQVGFRFIFGN